MIRRTSLFLTVTVLAAVLLSSTAAWAKPMTFDKAVDKLITQKYPQGAENYLDDLGLTPLGFRLAGTPADNAAADYVETQFTGMGLDNVRQEGVPVDVWDMQGAWVRVGGMTFPASQFDGVPGTPGAVSGQVVYVGQGTLADFAGKDVSDKIVLLDLELDDWWLNYPGALAALNGAKAVIATWNTSTAPWYTVPDSLGANDGEYQHDWAPMVYISRADGAILRSQVQAGPIDATVRSDVAVTMHDPAWSTDPAKGGVGYNVVGEITGTDPNAKAILFAAHHDAHFRAGLDDTGALANMLMIAKAMKMSGYKPQRTIIFLATTGEEFGYTDAWYDWCAGAWWAATQTHKSGTADPWTGPGGRVAAMLNLELMARKGARLDIGASTALAPWLRATAKANKALLPNGYGVSTPISSWEDGWTFTAAGVPAMVMEAGGKNYDQIYHTTVETRKLVDYAYLGKIAKFAYRLTKSANTGLLPIDLAAQARDLEKSVSGPELTGAGADATTVTAALQAMHDYVVATQAFKTRRIPAARIAATNAGLSEVASYFNTHLTGLDIWDYQAYPFQQTLWDVQNLDKALAHLTADPVQKDQALEDLGNVALTYYGTTFGPEVYAQNLVRYLPDYPQVTWGGQVNGAWHVDILNEVAMVDAGNYAAAIGALNAVRDDELTGTMVAGYSGPLHMDGLNERLAAMTAALDHMTPLVDALK